MAELQDPGQKKNLGVEEIPERLDEQHYFTTKTLGFLIHPNIPLTATKSPTLKIADIGTGTGIWLLDVANSITTQHPHTTLQLTGYDITSSAFPPPQAWPANVTFQIHDMDLPFPASELGTYDIVAVRFISSATPRAEWIHKIQNLVTLLKPGGWLQWIDSCNFCLYNSIPGTSHAACREIYDGLEPFRSGEDLVIGLMMRESGNVGREGVWRDLGFVDVHEDVFSTDRLQDPGLRLREKGTKNIIVCFADCLRALVGVEGSAAWTRERIDRLEKKAMEEVDKGVYHTLDQVCIVGRKPL